MKKERDLVRLKKVLLTDNLRIPNGAVELLKNDILTVLDGYFELDKNSLQLILNVDDNGEYRINVQAKAPQVRRIKTI